MSVNTLLIIALGDPFSAIARPNCGKHPKRI
jgi:hypothetical protein